jgi:hypothetical protein
LKPGAFKLWVNLYRPTESAVCASCAARDSNLLGAETKGNPVT